MKKSLLIIAIILASLFTAGVARTFSIERAFKVKVGSGKEYVGAGVKLNEKTKITIDDKGMLIFADKATGERWLVKKTFSGKVGDLIKKQDKSLITLTKSDFYNFSKPLMHNPSVAGGVYREVMPDKSSNPNDWHNDSTYLFINDIPTDSVTFFLIED